MVGLDQQIGLAEQLARELPEVPRNEWMRWLQVAERRGLQRAIQHAQRLSQDVTVRPAVQRANRLIAQAVRRHQAALQGLTEEERQAVLGFVGWWLQVKSVLGKWDTEERR